VSAFGEKADDDRTSLGHLHGFLMKILAS